MKIIKHVLILAAAAVFLTGCFDFLKSIYPFYTPLELVFDPGLLGKWVIPEDNKSGEGIEFRRLGGGAYLLIFQNSETNTDYFLAHLFEIKGRRFLDYQPTNRYEGFVPEHALWKMTLTSTQLQIGALMLDNLQEAIETNGIFIPHAKIQDDPNSSNEGRIVLTAETKELQTFILKYADDTNFFVPVMLQRAETNAAPLAPQN